MQQESGAWQGGKAGGCVAFQAKSAGYSVTIRDQRVPYEARFFSCSRHGSKEAALQAATSWQKSRSDALGLTKNQYRIAGDHAEVKLTRGFVMLVDVEDIPFVESEYWSVSESGGQRDHHYAACRRGAFHRLITGFKVVDHINRNTFDNRRSNLREVDATGNARNRKRSRNNTSGCGGVSRSEDKTQGPQWTARWFEDGRRVKRQFSVSMYGESTAKKMAIDARKHACVRLGIDNE